jgi:polysaccharide pyruvyl transferase WcaK-like protein
MLCRWILKDVDWVVTRDPISTREARRLGCDAVREVPDIVVTFDEGRIPAASASAPAAGRYGVVVPSPETPELDAVFLARLGELCRGLLGGRVERLLVPLQSHEDEAISRRFVAAIGDPRVELVDEDLSPEELMALYRNAEFLVGRRLHAGVFALLVGIPVALFGTDGVKAEGVMQELGLADRVFRYPDFPVEEVRRVIEEMMEGPQERARVRDAVGRARARASAGLDWIAEGLRDGVPDRRHAELGA